MGLALESMLALTLVSMLVSVEALVEVLEVVKVLLLQVNQMFSATSSTSVNQEKNASLFLTNSVLRFLTPSVFRYKSRSASRCPRRSVTNPNPTWSTPVSWFTRGSPREFPLRCPKLFAQIMVASVDQQV